MPKGEGNSRQFGAFDISIKQVTEKADYILTVLSITESKVRLFFQVSTSDKGPVTQSTIKLTRVSVNFDFSLSTNRFRFSNGFLLLSFDFDVSLP